MSVVQLASHRVEISEGVTELCRQHGSGMMDAGELTYLAAALTVFPWRRDAIVVEIGAFVGQTTVFLSRVLDLLGHADVPILSVDPFERAVEDSLNPAGSYSQYLHNIEEQGAARRCAPLVGFASDVATLVPERIGLLVVDGCHHYPAVSKDLELYTPKLLPCGVVFCDDYDPLHYPDVVAAVDEWLAREPRLSLLHKSYFAVAQKV